MSKAYVNNNNNNNTSSSPSSSSSNNNNKKRKLAEHLSTRFDESLESFLKRANPLWNKNGGKALQNVLTKLKRIGITELEGLCRVLFEESTRPRSNGSQNFLNIILKQAGKKTFATETIVLLQKAIGDSRIHVEKYGQKPIIITAPHSILLHRDGNRLHLPEDHTFAIAMAIANVVKGTSVVWSRRERDKSLARMQIWRKAKAKAENGKNKYTRDEIAQIADAAVDIDWVNRDPNFLYHEQQNPSESELNVNPWCNALQNMCKYYQIQQPNGNSNNNNNNNYQLNEGTNNMFHVDIHGKQNDGVSDLDLGLYCIAYDIEKRQKIREALSFELNKIFKDTDFKVNAYPSRFGGNWGQHFVTLDAKNSKSRKKKVMDEGVHPSRLTLSSYSSTLNMHSVQLELSKRLRDHLIRDQLLLTKFGDAIEFVYRTITSSKQRSNAFAAHSRRSPTHGFNEKTSGRSSPKVLNPTRYNKK